MVETEPPDDSDPADNTYELINRYRAGDKRALGKLIKRYYQRIEDIVRARTGPHLLARRTVADVVQDVMVRIIESAKQYERRSNAEFIDWVATLVEREIRNLARHDRTKKRNDGVAGEVGKHVEAASQCEAVADSTAIVGKLVRREEAERLLQKLNQLSEEHREVILLRFHMGHDWQTIAGKLGRTVEACQELCRRAKRELGRRWGNGDQEGEASRGGSV